jgi:hypothetical protein
MLNAAPLQACPFEGAFAYLPPIPTRFNSLYPVIPGGYGGQIVAGPDGLIVARFGWADLTANTVANTRTNAAQRLGFVQPVWGTWQRAYWDASPANDGTQAFFLRAGLPANVFARGGFWARFVDAAYALQPVYASLIDGSCISGEADDAEQTPWTVQSTCGPGELAIINTWSQNV